MFVGCKKKKMYIHLLCAHIYFYQNNYNYYFFIYMHSTFLAASIQPHIPAVTCNHSIIIYVKLEDGFGYQNKRKDLVYGLMGVFLYRLPLQGP